MSPHPPVHLFYPKYDLAMLLWCSLSGGLPGYSRDVPLTAFIVVQYQHNMTAAHTFPNSSSLPYTQTFSGVPQYSLIRPNIKKKKKNLGKANVTIYSQRRYYGGTFGIVLAHYGKDPGGIKGNMQPLIPLKLPKSTDETLFTTQLTHLFQSGQIDNIFTMVFCLQWHIRQ